MVITGTMYPLFADLLFGAKISVGAPFFNATALPLADAGVRGDGGRPPCCPWKRAALGPALLRLWWAGGRRRPSSAYWLLTRLHALPAFAFGGAAWLIVGSWAEIVERVRLFRIPLRDSAARLRGLPLSAFGAALAHAGMGVTIAGIAGMSLATQRVVLIHPGEQVEAAGMTWALDSLTDSSGSNYTERMANIRVIRPGQADLDMHPSRRTFPVQQITTTEAAIHTTGMADIYAVLGEERDGAAVMRLHYNPMAPWIWLGGLVMAMGGGLVPGRPAAARRRAIPQGDRSARPLVKADGRGGRR